MKNQVSIDRLISEFGYPPHGAQLVADKLSACDPHIYQAFLKWWEGGPLPDIAVEGYSLASLMKDHQMKPIAAFLTLDWLQREPDRASASLKKGHDRVGR